LCGASRPAAYVGTTSGVNHQSISIYSHNCPSFSNPLTHRWSTSSNPRTPVEVASDEGGRNVRIIVDIYMQRRNPRYVWERQLSETFPGWRGLFFFNVICQISNFCSWLYSMHNLINTSSFARVVLIMHRHCLSIRNPLPPSPSWYPHSAHSLGPALLVRLFFPFLLLLSLLLGQVERKAQWVGAPLV